MLFSYKKQAGKFVKNKKVKKLLFEFLNIFVYSLLLFVKNRYQNPYMKSEVKTAWTSTATKSLNVPEGLVLLF